MVSSLPVLLGTLVASTLTLLVACLRLLKKLPSVQKGTIGFFHPFADGGGGGERVLWCAVQAVQTASPTSRIVVYVREGVTAQELQQDAAKAFNIKMQASIEVIPLRRTLLLQPERYRQLTLLRQALGSVQVAWEALTQLVPEVYIETTGWAFTYPLARLAGCRVASYTHYPTVSTDLLYRVWAREDTYNNNSAIADSGLLSWLKLLYLQLFALLYGAVGAAAHVVCVNSTWTGAHIRQLWWRWRPPLLVYPPVDSRALQALPLDRPLKRLYLVSVAQFRPEKNHRLQLDAYALARRRAGSDAAGQAVRVSRLKVVGGCRTVGDEARLVALRAHADVLGVGDSVDWHVNVSFDDLKTLLGGAVGGLHTMVDEHFGISVVEYMAAGVIPIAHNSGGPRADIVVPQPGEDGPQRTGFLAASVDEYADAITQVLAMDQRDRLKIAAAAQAHARNFSTERFLEAFTDAVRPILPRT